VRLGYDSDPTFLEEWQPRQFYENGPVDVSAYLKRQQDTEAFTLLVEAQPNRLITTSDMMTNQFEVEQLPQVAYHREGDSALNNSVTLFSDNSAGGLEFQPRVRRSRSRAFSRRTSRLGVRRSGRRGSP